MNKEPEDIKDSLTPEEIEDLDIELIREVNQNVSDDDQGATVNTRNPIALKMIGFAVLLVFMVSIWSNWLWVINTLPLDFLTKSRELSQNPTIQSSQRAVAMLKVSERQGTGFNIDSNGLIITNEHVIKGAKNVNVSFQDGTIYSGSVLASYPDVDLAVIKIDGRNLPVLKLDMNSELAVDNEVIIIGNPLGFADVVMKGSIAGEIQLKGWSVPVIMIKGQVRPGSSGSPVLNSNGQVVAVIFGTIDLTAIDKQVETIGIAVPIKNLDRFFKVNNNTQ